MYKWQIARFVLHHESLRDHGSRFQGIWTSSQAVLPLTMRLELNF